MLVVNEIFDSIQGEGIHTGVPATFIRLTGCNLSCGWCDSKDALHNGKEMPVPEVVDAIMLSPPFVVVWTGGEPMLQWEGMRDVMMEIEEDASFHLETNGTLGVPYGWFDWVTVSPKPPDYIIATEFFATPAPIDEIKVVVTGEADLQAALRFSDWYPHAYMSLQPVSNNPKVVRMLMKKLPTLWESHPGETCSPGWRWRLSPQVHKLLGLR